MKTVESMLSSPGAEESAEARRWSEGLEAVACRLDKYFARSEGRQRLRDYLRGLLSPAERKNSWQLAEAVGEDTPYGIQHLLGRAIWSADQVRDDLLWYVQERLADKEGILVIDETGFLKKETKAWAWRVSIVEQPGALRIAKSVSLPRTSAPVTAERAH